MNVKQKKNKRYIKIPYSDNGDGLKNKEKQAFSIINKLIKKRNKTDGFHNKGFAKAYAFSGHQVKEIVSSHLYIMYASLDESDLECYMQIKKLYIENAIRILSCLLDEAKKFEENIRNQNTQLYDCIIELWQRIRKKLEHMLLYPMTANKVNKIDNSDEIAQTLLEEAKGNEKLGLAD